MQSKANLAAADSSGVSGSEAQDALRYRWLRDTLTWDISSGGAGDAAWLASFNSPYGMASDGDNSLDAAIDAAIKKKRKYVRDKPMPKVLK